VVVGSTPSVQYAYSAMAGGANHSRLISMTYPNGRTLHQVYNTGTDDALSRLSFLADDDGAGGIGTHLEEYSYLGLSTVVKRAHPEPGVDLTYIQQSGDPLANTDGGDQYTGLDRFGRIIDQLWIQTASGSAADRFQYGYDRDNNRLYEANLVAEALGQPFDELFHLSGAGNGYDGLERITDFALGQLNATRDSIVGTPGSQENWALDLLGNWSAFTSGAATQTRHHDAQNRISDINGNPLAYDNNGNTLSDDRGYTIVYDAWNRPVRVFDAGGNALAAYLYDAQGRRIQEFENDAFGNPTTRDLFFSAQWQVLEEWETDPFGNTVVRAQEVWSPVYVDALVLRDRDPSGAGYFTERLYALQDANWNVRSVVDTTGTVQERYVYDPYGQVTVWDPLYGQAFGGSQFGFVYLYQGGRLDSNTGLYHFRHRDYSPTLGRWLQQDPAGYVDGTNLYQAERSNPVTATDPQGLNEVDDWCGTRVRPLPPKFSPTQEVANPAVVSLAFAARDLMIPLASVNHFTDCTLYGTCAHYSGCQLQCSYEPTYCVATCGASQELQFLPRPPVESAHLAEVRAQLQQALSAPALGMGGSGMAFTTRDLMVPVIPFGCVATFGGGGCEAVTGAPCGVVSAPGGGCGVVTGVPCGVVSAPPPVCPLPFSALVVACQNASDIILHTIPECTCSGGPGDPGVSYINPAELSVLQGVLQQVVLQKQELLQG
jgi:RHS repeat-associated protein